MSRVPGCVCWSLDPPGTGEHAFEEGVDSRCPYHRAAAQNPDDHSIPWNCPTYWDGCNCAGRAAGGVE